MWKYYNTRNQRVYFIITTTVLYLAKAQDQTNPPLLPPYATANYAEDGRRLPPGVPKTVDINGNTIYVPERFTSDAYQKTALGLVLEEANHVAKEMRLPEELPITESNLTEFHISPFGFAFARKKIGYVATRNYYYYVASDDKFNQLVVANYDKSCLSLQKKVKLPISKIDTNSAYHLAMQWFAAASVDVVGLSRDGDVHVAVSPFWNGIANPGETPKQRFVPIYFIWWASHRDESQRSVPASMELYLPTKRLLQMTMSDSKYILRKPLVFTNLAALFPGIGTIHTNYPVAPVYISAPP